MTTSTDYLAEQKRLTEAATPGPWEARLLDGVDYEDGSSSYRGAVIPRGFPGIPIISTLSVDRSDAAFVAASRESAPRMIAALEAVIEMHPKTLGGDQIGDLADYCPACLSYWPCPTIRAIESALGGESDEC